MKAGLNGSGLPGVPESPAASHIDEMQTVMRPASSASRSAGTISRTTETAASTSASATRVRSASRRIAFSSRLKAAVRRGPARVETHLGAGSDRRTRLASRHGGLAPCPISPSPPAQHSAHRDAKQRSEARDDLARDHEKPGGVSLCLV